jgi:putative membrane protein
MSKWTSICFALAATSLAGCSLFGSARAPLQPAQFVQQTALENRTQIEMAKLALDRAVDKEVRKYASRSLSEHEASQGELVGVAAATGINLPKELDAGDRGMLEELANYRGRTFDRKYMDLVVVRKQDDFRDYEDAAKGATGPIAQFARTGLPTVRGQLDLARSADIAVEGTLNPNPLSD